MDVPAFLSMCALRLDRTEVLALQRDNPSAWTTSDCQLLDAARRRIGDPEYSAPAPACRRVWSERSRMDDVINDVIAADDKEMRVASMLRSADLRDAP